MRETGKTAIILALGVLLAACDDGKPAAPAAGPAADGKAIADYAARRAGCNHWGGEEGYDAARRAEIAKAAAALRCDRIDTDEAALLKRYSTQPERLQQIRAAKDKLL
jgi:hypothetical protein